MEGPEGTLGGPIPAGTQGLEWGAIDYDPALALRASVGYRWTPCDMGELRGTLFGSWDGESRQTGLFPFANRQGISPTATATLQSEADLATVELNWWHDFGGCGGFRWLGGIGGRYLRFDDTATARDWVGLAPTSFLQSDVENTVWAGQVLGALTYGCGCWEVTGSGRLFLGSMNRMIRIDEDSILSGGVKAAELENTEFGWGFELGLDVRYRFSPCFSLTAGYALVFIGDAQRAADAMDFTQGVTGAVQAQQQLDNVVAHSLFVGFQFDM